MSDVRLRDYFAAKAMQAMISSINSEAAYQRFESLANAQGLTVSQWISIEAFKQAEDMVRIR